MKRTKWIITTLAFFIVAVGFATETPKMNIIPVENEKALIAFNSGKPTLIELTIKNDDGDILYFKRSEKRVSEYQEIFDFLELGNGDYNVCLNYGNRSINRDLHVLKKEIIVGAAVQMYEPYFTFKNERLNVSFLNISQKNVFLNIYKDGEHLSKSRLGKDMTIQKCFDLSKLDKGDYKVVITDWFKDHSFIVHK